MVVLLVSEGVFGRSVYILAGAFVFLSIDEWLALHERFERSAQIDWQILYLPLICVAGIAWLRVFYVLRHDRLALASHVDRRRVALVRRPSAGG